MKKSSLFILFLLTFYQSQAQNDYKNLSYTQIDSLTRAEINISSFEKAINCAQTGVEKAKAEFGEQDTTYASMVYLLGFSYQMKQDFSTAKKYLQIALDLQKAKIPNSVNYANTLNAVAVLHFNTGVYELAESQYKEVLKIYKERLGEKHNYYINTRSNLANVYAYTGNYALAEPLYKKAIIDYKNLRGEKDPYYAQSMNDLGNLYCDIGNFVAAEPLYNNALKIFKEVLGEQHPYCGVAMMNLAILYADMSNYTLAESLYKEAAKIQKEASGDKSPYYAQNLHNLANLYKKMGNYPLAEASYLETLKLHKATLGEKHPEYANNLSNLASLYADMGKFLLAEPLQKEAVKTYKTILGAQHPSYARSLHTLAELYKSMGNYPLAEQFYKEAVIVFKEALGEKHAYYIGNLNNLATLYFFTKNYTAAWLYIQQAIAANSGIPISLQITKSWADSLATAEYSSMEFMLSSLNNIYTLLQKDSSKTANTNLKASQIIVADLILELLQKSRNGFSNEADKLRILSQSSDWVLQALAILDKNTQVNKAFALAEQSKSILLLDAIQTQQAHNFVDLPDALVQNELAFQKKRSTYEASIAEKRPESERDSLRVLLNKLNLDIKSFKDSIEKKFQRYTALKYQHKDANASEIQQLLDNRTALLEYVIGDSVVYVFYVDKKQMKLIPIYLSNKVLNEKIKTLHHTLSDYKLATKESALSYQKYTENAFWFYENLVKPALSNAKGTLKGSAKQISKLLIVSDGELGHLPFEAFLTKPAPQIKDAQQGLGKATDYRELHYLSNDYKISYNYSASIWKAAKESEKHTNNGQILAMASNYDLKINRTKIDWRLPYEQRLRELLKPLPAARKEIEILAENFNGFFAFDKDASEKNFKSKAGDFAIIHLAMHGLLDNKAPILSSLAFTEDSDSLENNFLHAYEISKMKLNADLVVLSACETGYGRFEKGNGIASLAQAFAYAGAPAMIVSLWQVNDYATSEIMKNLYQNLADGMEKDEALQQAKIKYMKEAKGVLAHPAFWSPFILMGNTDSITLGRTRGFTPTWIIGIGLLLLLGGGYWWTQRKK